MDHLREFLATAQQMADELNEALRADRFSPLEPEWVEDTNPHTGNKFATAFILKRVTEVKARQAWHHHWQHALRERPDIADRIDILAEACRALDCAAAEASDRNDYMLDAKVYADFLAAFHKVAPFVKDDRDAYRNDERLTLAEREIIEALGNDCLSGKELSKRSGHSEALIRQRMKHLKDLKYVERQKANKTKKVPGGYKRMA
jgi:hypothetical protein